MAAGANSSETHSALSFIGFDVITLLLVVVKVEAAPLGMVFTFVILGIWQPTGNGGNCEGEVEDIVIVESISCAGEQTVPNSVEIRHRMLEACFSGISKLEVTCPLVSVGQRSDLLQLFDD